jgi:D-alanine-D-alanine ligase
MARTSVGILRGGTSSEYDLSLKTGAAMLSALPEDRFDTRDIFVDKSGLWHSRGIPVDAARALNQIDVVLNALHGGAGEDGTVQRLLERAGVAYAGSRSSASALALNKVRAAQTLREAGVAIPRGASFSIRNQMTTAEMARAVFESFGPPYIIKPTSEGAGEGIEIALSIIELPDALGNVLDRFGGVQVQEYLRGQEASAGVIEDFRGEELYALPPAQVMLPEGSRFLERSHHEQALARHVAPSNFSHEEKRLIEDAARAAHRALGLSHFSRADIMLVRGKPYVLEVNTVPGLYQGASLPVMLEAVGSSVPEFLAHVIALAQN